MIDIIIERIKQKKRTIKYPSKKILMPRPYRGKPEINENLCTKCESCIKCCPVNAISMSNGAVVIDIGKCIFCLECTLACKSNAIRFTDQYKLACSQRSDLLIKNNSSCFVRPLEKKRLKVFKKSLKLRLISAGGCNACEADINVLNTLTYDLQRFGIQIVASPRHADGIIVTGPVTKNMLIALKKTYYAVSTPKVVIAIGACAVSGGIFCDHTEVGNGIGSLFSVDLYIPGCPPHPLTILDGLLRLIGRIKNE